LPNKPKTFSKIFSATPNLGRLNQHINQIKQFEERLRKLLPTPIAEDYSWSVGNFRDRHLTLFTTNPGQASRLRFQQTQFLEGARSILSDIETLSIRMSYQGKITEEGEKVKRRLSLKAAEEISAFAEHIDDSELKVALKRLSQRGDGH